MQSAHVGNDLKSLLLNNHITITNEDADSNQSLILAKSDDGKNFDMLTLNSSGRVIEIDKGLDNK